ncbi:MAG: hypothetical protein AAF401_15550, partial [Pseudomonadota bacterium]
MADTVVVLIHGIGRQEKGQTLKQFASVAAADNGIVDPQISIQQKKAERWRDGRADHTQEYACGEVQIGKQKTPVMEFFWEDYSQLNDGFLRVQRDFAELALAGRDAILAGLSVGSDASRVLRGVMGLARCLVALALWLIAFPIAAGNLAFVVIGVAAYLGPGQTAFLGMTYMQTGVVATCLVSAIFVFGHSWLRDRFPTRVLFGYLTALLAYTALIGVIFLVEIASEGAANHNVELVAKTFYGEWLTRAWWAAGAFLFSGILVAILCASFSGARRHAKMNSVLLSVFLSTFVVCGWMALIYFSAITFVQLTTPDILLDDPGKNIHITPEIQKSLKLLPLVIWYFTGIVGAGIVSAIVFAARTKSDQWSQARMIVSNSIIATGLLIFFTIAALIGACHEGVALLNA